MAYTLAPSLVHARAEVNAGWPGRDKTSDGWIGDTAHQSTGSDHNPGAATSCTPSTSTRTSTAAPSRTAPSCCPGSSTAHQPRPPRQVRDLRVPHVVVVRRRRARGVDVAALRRRQRPPGPRAHLDPVDRRRRAGHPHLVPDRTPGGRHALHPRAADRRRPTKAMVRQLTTAGVTEPQGDRHHDRQRRSPASSPVSPPPTSTRPRSPASSSPGSTPHAIAAAIPDTLAADVADELAARLANG